MSTVNLSATSASPLDYRDGYPALEDLGLIGDGTTASLVARDGAVVWLCVPRFDSEPLFCSLLDTRRGGSFRIAPEDLVEASQRYEPDSGVLVTELRCPTGLVRITDCLTLRSGADLTEDTPAGRGELLRSVVVLDGTVTLRVGLHAEARGFLGWVLDSIERDGDPRVLYTLDGLQPPPERADPDLEGYRRSAPVRWGNAAAGQRQHDAYGEILDCAYQWVAAGSELDPSLWGRLSALVEEARARWDQPDHGIWEVRTSTRPFTYSAAMCQVALDRGARLARRLGLPGDVAGWAAEAERIQAAILELAWDAERGCLTEHLGPGGLDASLLALPLRRVVEARHPKMIATTAAITERLGAGDGLLYRYLPDESADGLPGHEGAFLLCSFWLVDNLAAQGRLDEAMGLYDSLCGRAGVLGLLPEEIEPSTGAFVGNYPQAFSHVGVVSSGMNLARQMR